MRTSAALLLAVLFLASSGSSADADPQGASRSVRVLEPMDEAPEPFLKSDRRAALPRPPRKNSGVRVEILPAAEFAVGTTMMFRVTAERTGYVVLVDVDAQGKLSQIYPNMVTLSNPAGVDDKANFLRAGQSITLPNDGAGSGFRFIASPPTGVGMVVAILSDTPVQVIDLPDVPTALAGQVKAAEFVEDSTRSLQILPTESSRPLTPKWAFSTGFYEIR